MSDKATTTPNKKRRGITRRQFLIGLGTGVGVLAVGAVLGGPTLVREVRLGLNQAFLTGELPPGELPKSPFIWLEINADGTTTIYPPKIEMGQGIHTTLAQIAAEELELDWETVRVKQPDTTSGFDPELLFTFGSTSTTALYRPIREIAATMREMLRTEAAQQLGVNVADVVAERSTIRSQSDSSKTLTYAQVVAAKQGDWVIPENPGTLKAKADFKLIGTPVQRVDLVEKVTGRAVYGYDARLPNMAYGAIARPPRYDAKLVRAAAGTAAEQPGVIQVVLLEGFAGVVAQTRTQAYKALEFLDLTWEGGTTISQAEIDALVTAGGDDGILIQRDGDVDSQLNNGTLVSAEYRTPMAAHAHLEPQAALVDVKAGAVTAYVSTQSPGLAREFIAKALGVEQATVQVVPTYIGGGFGRKIGTDVGVEAALLSRAVGRPVHVGWNRTEDLRYGYRRPPVHNVLKASVDDQGNILAMEHRLASGDVFFYVQQLQGSSFLQTMLGADPLAAYGSLLHYSIPNRRVIYYHKPLPVPTAFWRGLGSFPNTFAVETFMDEVAAAAGADPFAIRRRYLPEGELGERFSVALDAVEQASGWATPPAEGRARGLATAYDRGTVVALVVEVSIGDNNAIRVHHAWCAVDPGLVVNPDGAAAQVQGSIIMALSSTLYERLTVENGMVTNENFNQYPLLTIRDAPNIEVIPINSSDEPVGGLGEPVIGTIPAAVSNAVFALNGQRLREMPFRLTET